MRGGYRGLGRRTNPKTENHSTEKKTSYAATDEPPLPPMRSFDRLSTAEGHDDASKIDEPLREPVPLANLQHKADVKMGKCSVAPDHKMTSLL